MIIWSGFGILVGLVGLVGMVAGFAIGAAVGMTSFAMGLGLGMAALGNWGVWKMIYPKNPRVLVDPATGQQMVMKANHSLFFIPAKAWTWIFLILAVPVTLLGVGGEQREKQQALIPGYTEFEAADALISSKRHGANHGNSEAANLAAAGFGKQLGAFCEIAFSGGSKKNLMTGGQFLTYCQDTPDTIVFLCHVPSLRSFKSDETRDSLAEIAWASACLHAAALDPDKSKKLIVGLRGITTYGIVMQGPDGSPTPARSASPDKAELFYPAFATSVTTP